MKKFDENWEQTFYLASIVRRQIRRTIKDLEIKGLEIEIRDIKAYGRDEDDISCITVEIIDSNAMNCDGMMYERVPFYFLLTAYTSFSEASQQVEKCTALLRRYAAYQRYTQAGACNAAIIYHQESMIENISHVCVQCGLDNFDAVKALYYVYNKQASERKYVDALKRLARECDVRLFIDPAFSKER